MFTTHVPTQPLVAVVACLVIASTLAGCDAKTEAPPISWSLTIDFGEGKTKEFAKLAGHDGMTVLAAMQAASKDQQGFKFATVGDRTGKSAFIDHIEGVKNEGAGAEAKNWTYELNGQRAQLGAGSQKLKDGDVVLWKFGVAPVE